MRHVRYVPVVTFVVLAAACDSEQRLLAPISSPRASLATAAGKSQAPLVVSPDTLTFTAVGPQEAETVTAAVKYAGTLIATPSPSCAGVVTVSPTQTRVDPHHGARFAISPLGRGTCLITVTDKKDNAATVAVSVEFASFWTTKASMPTGRTFLGVGVVNGILFAVGGYAPGLYLSTVEAYDPSNDIWTTKAPMPTAQVGMAVGVVNGILYTIGGGPTYSAVYAYDPVANTWTSKAPMPTARSMLGAAVVNGIIYAVGGMDYQPSGLGTVEAYDPATNTWTTKAPMPTPRGYLGVAVVNGVMYAVGGDAAVSGSPVATVEAYDPATNSWTTRAPMPEPRSQVGVGVVGDILYVVGGNPPGTGWSVSNTVYAYDPTTNTWTTKEPMPTPRISVGVGVVSGILYAVGGNLLVVPPASHAVEAYYP